jgi:glycine cleavage system H lipoate-binding protein
MIALLVVLTFLAGIILDLVMTRRAILVADETGAETPRPRVFPPMVAGFAVAPNVKYHPGHTWALAESPELVRVGIDDLAARVAGDITKIDIPERGQWIRQGQRIIALHRGGKELALVSPIEGTVVGINEEVLRDPKLAKADPYGDGWLLTVNSPDAKTNFRNLLDGRIARRWMEEAAVALRNLTPSLVGATAQDGGVAIDLPVEQAEKIQKEIFLI